MGSPETDKQVTSRKRWLARVVVAFLAVIAMALATAWFSRERIAGNLIDSYLKESDLEASYDIVSIGTGTQIIENLVIGDPSAPDLTVKRVRVDVAYGFGVPSIDKAVLEQARLYGSFRDGQLSFGSLDDLLFAETNGPAGLPAIDVSVIDGGALVRTDFGDVGGYISGSGRLDDGFAGKLALTAPDFAMPDCAASSLTAYGDLLVEGGTPRFEGPVRLRDADCQGARIESLDSATDVSFDLADGTIAAALNLLVGKASLEGNSFARASGSANLSFQNGNLTMDHDLALEDFASPYGSLANVGITGDLRSQANFARSDWSLQITGEGAGVPNDIWASLRRARDGSEGTFAAPLLAKLERGLRSGVTNGTLDAELIWRVADDDQSVVVPKARFQSSEGETLIAISRLAWLGQSDDRSPSLSGNFLTGGAGLPQINGRVEQLEQGDIAMRMTMAEYSVGPNHVALPSLSLTQQRDGAFRLSGLLEAGGDLPGGSIQGLRVPLNGRIDPAGAVQLGLNCQTVRFTSLTIYDLSLAGQSSRLCPIDGEPILRYADAIKLSAQADTLALTGELAGSPAAVAAGGVRLRYPGVFAIDDLDAAIGEEGNAMTLSAALLFGELGDSIGGLFEGASARIDAIPLDLDEMSGRWTYADETLRLSDVDLTLTERIVGQQRFEPLASGDAVLTMAGNSIAAAATLQHKEKGVEVAEVLVGHDLASAKGTALIDVERLTFGPGFALTDLTYLAEGVVAYTDGTVTGEGRVVWDGDDIQSDGVFRSDGLDLAAAFGPVQGLKGEVRFSDLLNMTTEPGQVIEIASINPGIEVFNGRLRFALTNGELIAVEDARWPFMGGTLIMRPTTLRYGTDEEQRYTFEMIALDAAKFVTQMELTNLGATGTFDGTVPIVFDVNGNGRIEQGLLISRPPGGNVSYIGELTYEDLGTMGNYAFQSLRSLDYSQMSVALDGALAGEIITRFQFDGVRQGEGATRNFVTRRLAKLPIRFNVNVRSENFYELAVMVRRFYDTDALPDPVDQGLLSVDGERFVIPPERRVPPPDPVETEQPDAMRPDESTVQPPESDPMP